MQTNARRFLPAQQSLLIHLEKQNTFPRGSCEWQNVISFTDHKGNVNQNSGDVQLMVDYLQNLKHGLILSFVLHGPFVPYAHSCVKITFDTTHSRCHVLFKGDIDD